MVGFQRRSPLRGVWSGKARLRPPGRIEGSEPRARAGSPPRCRLPPAARPRTRGSSRACRTARLRRARGSCRRASRSTSRPPPQTSSTASSVHPPTKTDRRRKSASSSSSRRSTLHPIVSRSARWRDGASCQPEVRSSSRFSIRVSIVVGDSTFTRVAASSIASGRSSRCPQIAAIASRSVSSG